MRNANEAASTLKIRICFAVLTIAGLIVLAGAYSGSEVRGAASTPSPRVTSISQITHDGIRKTNLLAGDSQLYVTELPQADRVVAKVMLPGADRSLVTSPFSSLQALDLSPDRTRLLVSATKGSSTSEFWTLPVGAGSPVRLGDLGGRDASWSRDGKQLAFGKGSILYIANASGTQPHEVFKAGGSVFAPRISPDGRHIRFTVSDLEQNTTSLWEVGSDGSNPHSLLGNWQYKSAACCGNWTSDGHYYIFQATQTVSNTTTLVTSLWALSDSAADNNPVALTNGPMSFGNASPAPDNRKLWAIGVQPVGEVVKYDPAKKSFSAVVAGLSATDLDFSADGKWITYVSIPEGTIWRSRANGTDRLQLTSGPEKTALPHWSPDGKQIAYVSMQRGRSWKISLVSAEGGKSHELLAENGSQIDATWSADGSRLMFGSVAFDTNGLSIRIFDFKTHQTMTVPGSQSFFSPRWSPDGRYIAALAPGNTKLLLFDFDTQKWTTWLTEPAGAVNYPVWSSDSKYLYFDDLVNDAESIRRVKVGATEAEPVIELSSFDRYPGALGNWSGRAPDGAWMFVRDRSTQEVYELSMVLP